MEAELRTRTRSDAGGLQPKNPPGTAIPGGRRLHLLKRNVSKDATVQPHLKPGVEVSGRVVTPDGRGLRNAIVAVVDSNGITRTATTSSFGYYRFEDVEVGRTYVMTVSSKRYRYATHVVTVFDTLADVNFVGLE